MSDTAKMFNDEDFLFLIKLLMPGSTDTPRMIRVLRDDEEILEGMLKDEKLFSYLLENPDSLIKVSPYLFFAALLNRVKYDLEHKAYTLEPGELHPVFVFDSHEVVTLLKDISIRNYLADMLVSFIRINSITIPIRIRKGIWRKLRISDFDIDSLIRYSQMISEHQRFFPYKRIADVCLFTTGILTQISSVRLHPPLSPKNTRKPSSEKSLEDLSRHGSYFYKAAAEHRMAQERALDRILMHLSRDFHLASKPLTYMATRYLHSLKEDLFLW